VADNLDFTFGGQSIKQLLADEGVLFNIRSITGDGLLGAAPVLVDRDGADGARLNSSHLPSRSVVVEFDIATGGTVDHDALVVQAAVERIVNGVLHRPGLAELRLSYRDGYFLATAGDVPDVSKLMNAQSGSIEFVCPSPFLYGWDEVTSPFENGVVRVHTNYFVEPVIVWTLSAAHGAPFIEVDGRRLTVDTQVSSGQQVRIDCARKEVRVGGVLNVENIDGVFPQLRDGSTIVTSPGGSVEIQYQERWI